MSQGLRNALKCLFVGWDDAGQGGEEITPQDDPGNPRTSCVLDQGAKPEHHGQGCSPSLGSSILVEIEMLLWGEAGFTPGKIMRTSRKGERRVEVLTASKFDGKGNRKLKVWRLQV